MFSNRKLIEGAHQFMAWSAMCIMLIYPVGLQHHSCPCSSGKVPSCCASSSKNSCERGEDLDWPGSICCCVASKAVECLDCQCGEQCQCGKHSSDPSPIPAIPANDSTTERVFGIACIGQTVCCLCETIEGAQNIITKWGSPRSLSAQQVCALLSRFTC